MEQKHTAINENWIHKPPGFQVGQEYDSTELIGTEKTTCDKGPEPGPLYYMSYIHIMEYYTALKMNYLQIHPTICMKLSNSTVLKKTNTKEHTWQEATGRQHKGGFWDHHNVLFIALSAACVCFVFEYSSTDMLLCAFLYMYSFKRHSKFLRVQKFTEGLPCWCSG